MNKAQIIDLLQAIPDDEPLFLVRGQDRIAPGLVKYYASAAAARGASPPTVAAARFCAEEMERYPNRKWPK